MESAKRSSCVQGWWNRRSSTVLSGFDSTTVCSWRLACKKSGDQRLQQSVHTHMLGAVSLTRRYPTRPYDLAINSLTPYCRQTASSLRLMDSSSYITSRSETRKQHKS